MNKRIMLVLLLLLFIFICLSIYNEKDIEKKYDCIIYNSSDIPIGSIEVTIKGVFKNSFIFRDYFKGNLIINENSYYIKRYKREDFKYNDKRAYNFFTNFYTEPETGYTINTVVVFISYDFEEILYGRINSIEEDYGANSYIMSSTKK